MKRFYRDLHGQASLNFLQIILFRVDSQLKNNECRSSYGTWYDMIKCNDALADVTIL